MKKIFGFIECDTIFLGDLSIHGKLHTIENGVRAICVIRMIDKWYDSLQTNNITDDVLGGISKTVKEDDIDKLKSMMEEIK